MGWYLRKGLEALARRHALVGEVCGAGRFGGLELVTDHATRAPATAKAARVVSGLRWRQVLLSATGPDAHVLKIRPPLVFQREHADLLVQRLDDVLYSIC